MRRIQSLGLLALVVATCMVQAQTSSKGVLKLAVSEGSSGGIDADSARAKYQPLADVLGKAMGTEVKVVFVREFAALEKGMQDNQFELVVARPSDYPARGLRDYQYRFVATAKPDGQCMLIVRQDSPLKQVSDLKGKRFILPEKKAYMSRFCTAELRDQGIVLDTESVTYVREQGAIPFAIENKISDVGGVASYSGAYKQWQASGHRVIHQSKPQPYMPLVASRDVSADQIAKMQSALVELGNSDSGAQVLKHVGVKGFTTTDESRLRKLLEWLGV
jgi:ABC-type phosphate/phosphonate transport system substrate-binding protein